MRSGRAAGIRRRGMRLGVAVLVMLFASLGSLAWVQPALAAFACPTCFGFARIAPHLYADRDMQAAGHNARWGRGGAGEARVAAVYGASNPAVILAGVTDACARRIGAGGSRGAAYATFG